MRSKTTAIVAFLAVSSALAMGAPNVALAQPKAPAAAPAGAKPAAPAAPSGDVAAAKAKFEKGKTLFNSKNFADALVEFRASYALVKSPNSHFFIANCLRDLGRSAEAYAEYDRVSDEARTAGEQYAGAIDAAIAERDALAPKIVLVNVTSTSQSDASLTVGGNEVPAEQRGKPIPVMPGNIEVKLSAPGKTPVTQSVTGAAGETKAVTIDFPVDTPIDNSDQPGGEKKLTPLRIGAIAAAGVGVAGMILFAIEGSASNSTYDDLKAKCGGPCPQQFAADVDKGKMQQTLANVGLGVGIAGLAVGTTLFVLSMKKKQPDSTQPQTTWLIGPGSLGVRGTF